MRVSVCLSDSESVIIAYLIAWFSNIELAPNRFPEVPVEGLPNENGVEVFADPESLPNSSDAETLAGFDPKRPVPPFEEDVEAEAKPNAGTGLGLPEDFAPKRFGVMFEAACAPKPPNPVKNPEDGRVSPTGSVPHVGISFGAEVPKSPPGEAIIGCGAEMPPPKSPPPEVDAV
jgi:hypothetical protein